MLSGLVDGLRAALREEACRWCGSPAAGPVPLCDACRAELPWNRPACGRCALPLPAPADACTACATAPAFDAACAALRYEAPVSGLIHGLKYDARLGDAPLLGGLLVQALQRHGPPWPDLLLPVPLHRWRLLRRGYNQAVELARVVARELPVRLYPGLARRLRATADQTQLAAPARRANMAGAFAVRGDLTGRRIALLDDVMTTGATLGALADACRAAGAARVEAWAVARTP